MSISNSSKTSDLPWLRRILRASGIDRAIGYTVLARGWGSLAGLITIGLIAHSLTRAEQGFYYTFYSMVALQIVFELGFSVVILQLASHEAAHLEFAARGKILGEPQMHGRLASVFKKAVIWYGAAGLLMVAVLLPVGWYFFRGTPGSSTVAWQMPWVCVVLASCLTFQIDPIFSFLEGCGMVSKVARTRWQQAMAGSVLAWCTLLLHHGLFAPAAVIATQAFVGLIMIIQQRHLLLGLLWHKSSGHVVKWATEVWPFQWRIAVSYASGFFLFQVFNPVLLKYYGPIVAGRMGMSLNIANALAAVAIAWINTKAAPFGAMISRREFVELDRIFFRALAQTMLLCVTGSFAVWLMDVVMNRWQIPFAQRLLPPLPFALLLTTMCINQMVASMAVYLRAHKQEKFLLNSVGGAVLVFTSTILLGRRYGATGMMAGYLAVAVVIGMGTGTYTFLKYRRLWHG